MPPAEAINLHEGHAQAAQSVLKEHLESLGQAVVLLPAGAQPEASAAAVLHMTLTRLGEKVKVRLVLEEGGGKKDANLDAMSPEDLDTVLMRLARHLVNGEPLDESRISEVTDDEASAYARKRANSYFGLQLLAMPIASGGASSTLAGASAYWLYDMRNFLADIQFGFGVPQGDVDGHLLALTLAGLLPLSDKDLTPFVGGGVGYGSMGVGNILSGNEGTGLHVFGDLGVLYGRTNTVHFRADVRPFVTTYKVHDKNPAYGAQAGIGVGF